MESIAGASGTERFAWNSLGYVNLRGKSWRREQFGWREREAVEGRGGRPRCLVIV